MKTLTIEKLEEVHNKLQTSIVFNVITQRSNTIESPINIYDWIKRYTILDLCMMSDEGIYGNEMSIHLDNILIDLYSFYIAHHIMVDDEAYGASSTFDNDTVGDAYEHITKLYNRLNEGQIRTFTDKNTDYGDSFTKSINRYGNIAAWVRISDKVERFKALTGIEYNIVDDEFVIGESKKPKVTNEKVEDTLKDLINYLVMLRAVSKEDVV